jgi:hypothetical protein
MEKMNLACYTGVKNQRSLNRWILYQYFIVQFASPLNLASSGKKCMKYFLSFLSISSGESSRLQPSKCVKEARR